MVQPGLLHDNALIGRLHQRAQLGRRIARKDQGGIFVGHHLRRMVIAHEPGLERVLDRLDGVQFGMKGNRLPFEFEIGAQEVGDGDGVAQGPQPFAQPVLTVADDDLVAPR